VARPPRRARRGAAVRAAALAVLGAVGLAVSAALQWFRYAPSACGWTCYSPLPPGSKPVRYRPIVESGTALGGLGTVAAVALVVCVLAALAAPLRAVRGGAGARLPLSALSALSVVATVVLVARVVTQPGLGRDLSNSLVDVTPAAWAGVGFAVLATLGVALARRAAPRASLS
jgi:heme/copper-type cytochrome/quinol oxidase subunit 1